jgi:hypothetical protein
MRRLGRPEDCRKSRISIEREDTTALAGIGTITTDRNLVTLRYPWYFLSDTPGIA